MAAAKKPAAKKKAAIKKPAKKRVRAKRRAWDIEDSWIETSEGSAAVLDSLTPRIEPLSGASGIPDDLGVRLQCCFQSADGAALLMHYVARAMGYDPDSSEAELLVARLLGWATSTPERIATLRSARRLREEKKEQLDRHLDMGGELLLSSVFDLENESIADSVSYTKLLRDEPFLGLLMRHFAQGDLSEESKHRCFAIVNAFMRKKPLDGEREAYFESVWSEQVACAEGVSQ